MLRCAKAAWCWVSSRRDASVLSGLLDKLELRPSCSGYLLQTLAPQVSAPSEATADVSPACFVLFDPANKVSFQLQVSALMRLAMFGLYLSERCHALEFIYTVTDSSFDIPKT